MTDIEHESLGDKCYREGPHPLTECGFWLDTIDGRLYQLRQGVFALGRAISNAFTR